MNEAEQVELYERFLSDVIAAIDAAKKATRTTTIEHYTSLLRMESNVQHAVRMLEKRWAEVAE